MSTLLWGNFGIRPPLDVAGEDVVTTVTDVDPDDAPAVADDAPDYNELYVDEVTNGGLTGAQLASAVTPSQRSVALPTGLDVNRAVQAEINDGQATKGTAAGREAAGIFGHGTLKIVEGIEPVLRDGGAFGNAYFSAENRPETHAGATISPTASTADAAVRTTAAINARNAVTDSQGGADIYAAYLNGFNAGM